jgi:hypothetical protein
LGLITTAPSVIYNVYLNSGQGLGIKRLLLHCAYVQVHLLLLPILLLLRPNVNSLFGHSLPGLSSGEMLEISNPAALPEAGKRDHIEEPYVKLDVITPKVGNGAGRNLVASHVESAWSQRLKL